MKCEYEFIVPGTYGLYSLNYDISNDIKFIK